VEGFIGASKVLGLDPARKYDALSFVELDEQHVPLRVVEQVGRACPNSGVESTCLLDAQAPVTGYYFAESDVAYALVASSDDEHIVLDYWGLRDWLGPIDTPNEAAIMAWSEGHAVECADLRTQAGTYYFPNQSECGAEEEWVEVGPDGSVSQSAFCVGL
jgi:hypothetical protein